MTTYRLSFDNLMHVKCLATAIFIGNVGGWGVGGLGGWGVGGLGGWGVGGLGGWGVGGLGGWWLPV